MGEINSDDHCIYYCGQESLRRNGVAIMVNKRVQNAVLGCNLKNDRMISRESVKKVISCPSGSKIQCYKEQYCIGTWNVRSMNQGNLEVVGQTGDGKSEH